MTARRWPETLLWIAVAAIGVGLLEVLPIPRDSVFWGRAFDSAHVPLFGGFAFVMLRLSRLWLPGRNPFLVALVGVGLLAGMTEAMQIVTPRDADVMDGIRDIVGGAAMLGFCWSFRPGPVWRARLVRIVAVLIVLASFIPLARCVHAYRVRTAAFPRIAAFESATEIIFFDTRGADLDFGHGVATVRFRAGGSDYPRFGFEVMPDWRGYQRLVLEVENPAPEPVTLNLRIHDVHHDRYTFDDRFNTEFVLASGPQRLVVALAAVEHAPANRRLDLAAVKNVTVFLEPPARDTTLRFTSMRLE